MKAVIYTKYGGPEELQLREIDTPVPKDDEVLVHVHAVSLNDWDWGLLQGDPINRMMYGLVKPKKQILGSDIAGTISAVGKKANRFQPGDEVYGDLSGTWGGLAEFVCARETSLAKKPVGMSFIDAASIPQAAMLAVQALHDVGKLKAGQKLLINGAGGGVGTFGLQLAKLQGVEVTGVDRASKFEMMHTLGFDHLIDYRKEDFTKNRLRYDLILDVKTNRPVFDYARSLTKNGTYVTVGGSILKLLQTLILAPLVSKKDNKHFRIVALKPNKDLEYINMLFEAGKLKPVIERPYTLENAKDAFALFASGEHRGKIVITI